MTFLAMQSQPLFAFGLAFPITLCLIGELKLMKSNLTIAFRLETPPGMLQSQHCESPDEAAVRDPV